MAAKKSSSSSRSGYEAFCSRLGVKPKQFSILLAITILATGGLGVRMFMKPRAATAATATEKKRPGTAAKADATEKTATGPTISETLDPLEIVLDTRPSRNPFHPFFIFTEDQKKVAGGSVAAAPVQAAPKGLVLQAVMKGELAVINGETYAVGDAILDTDGKEFVISEIHERTVHVRQGAHTTEVRYSTGNKKKSGAGSKK